jgi:patatin-like phospholipase
MPFGELHAFNDVFRAEIAVINDRRSRQRPARDPIVLETEADDGIGEPVLGPNENANVVGLALSGGGIRSSAFCLGALQALNEAGVLEQVDYLSTVSGGGYIGCSLSAGLESTQGKFPFESRIVEEEAASVQHLRDHSNYLFPQGAIDVLHNASIYVRGLVANFLLIMPFLLIAAAATVVLNPTIGDLRQANVYGVRWLELLHFGPFIVTAYLGPSSWSSRGACCDRAARCKIRRRSRALQPTSSVGRFCSCFSPPFASCSRLSWRRCSIPP